MSAKPQTVTKPYDWGWGVCKVRKKVKIRTMIIHSCDILLIKIIIYLNFHTAVRVKWSAPDHKVM